MTKLQKGLVALAGTLAVLLLTSTVVVLKNGGELSKLLSHGSSAADSTASAGTQAETDPNTAVIPTENPDIPNVDMGLRLAVTDISDCPDPLSPLCDGDRTLLALTQVNLLTKDREGQPVFHALDGETVAFRGTDYLYSGIANIDWDYNADSNITTYRLEIGRNIRFSDGEKMDIDDVIFNYYLRLQPEYTGDGAGLRSLNIVGLDNYYYNSSAAEELSVSEEEIRSELANPSDETARYIRDLIAGTLEEQRDYCNANWLQYQSYGYGDSAQEFFFKLYGLDLNYNPTNKDLVTVCRDVIESYGLNYSKLGENYAVDEHYFDEQVNSYVKELLYYNKIRASEAAEVDYVCGIVRYNYYTLYIRINGQTGAELAAQLFDLNILPLHYYGSESDYDYYAHRYGFEAGTLTTDSSVLPFGVGAGPFALTQNENGTAVLLRNDYYFGGEVNLREIDLVETAYPVEALIAGEVDAISVTGDADSRGFITMTNSNGELTGDRITTVAYEKLGYSYIGINAENVKVAAEPASQQSKALRTALATVFAYYREKVYSGYFAGAVRVIDYPMSDFFGFAPKPGSDAYRTVYSTDLSGQSIVREGATEDENYQALLQTMIELFVKAGYTFDEESRTLTAAPEGASLLFEVLVCSDESSFHPSYYVLDYAKAALKGIGISLDIRFMAREEDMLVNLYMGKAQIWCASWNTPLDPDYQTHYSGEQRSELEEPNIYGIDDDRLNEAIAMLKDADSEELCRELYDYAAAVVMEWAVEVPCYQQYDYNCFRSSKVNAGSLSSDYTEYWSLLQDIAHIEVLK